MLPLEVYCIFLSRVVLLLWGVQEQPLPFGAAQQQQYHLLCHAVFQQHVSSAAAAQYSKQYIISHHHSTTRVRCLHKSTKIRKENVRTKIHRILF